MFSQLTEALGAYFQKLPDILTAIGTIGATIVALWFGIFGNRETRLLIKNKEKELEKAAFDLLTRLPDLNDAKEKDMEIDKFEKKLNETIYISNKKANQLNEIINLAKKFSFALTDIDKQQPLFNEIKIQAQLLAKNVSNTDSLQNLFRYEARAYWPVNVFLVSPFNQDQTRASILIFTDSKNSGASGGDQREIEAARQLITREFLEANNIQVNNFYQEASQSKCIIIYPKDDYKLIEEPNQKICIRYHNQDITLTYRQPQTLRE